MEQKDEQKDGQTFIPLYDDILKLSDITPTDKIVLSLICSFSKDGDCFASNEYISERTGIPKRSIERIISKLENKKYLFFHLTVYTDEKGKVKGNKRQLWTFKDNIPDYAQMSIRTDYAQMSTPSTHRCVHPLRTDAYHIKKIDNKDILESSPINSPSCGNNTDEGARIIPIDRNKDIYDYLENVLPKQIDKALGDEYDLMKDEYVKCYQIVIKYFFQKYAQYRGENHPAYKYEHMKRCIDNLECVSVFKQFAPYNNEYFSLVDVEGMKECVDIFFEHDNKRNPHDYKLLVFTDPENMKYILFEEYNDQNFIEWGVSYSY